MSAGAGNEAAYSARIPKLPMVPSRRPCAQPAVKLYHLIPATLNVANRCGWTGFDPEPAVADGLGKAANPAISSAPEFCMGNTQIFQGLGFGTKLLINAQRKSAASNFSRCRLFTRPLFESASITSCHAALPFSVLNLFSSNQARPSDMSPAIPTSRGNR